MYDQKQCSLLQSLETINQTTKKVISLQNKALNNSKINK